MRPRRSALSLALCVAALAACGGGGKPHLRSSDARPLIALAHRIPQESSCEQARDIRALRRRATTLLNSGRVPAALQEQLSSGVNAIASETPTCLPAVQAAEPTPAPPPTTTPAPPPNARKPHGPPHGHHPHPGHKGKK